MNYLIGDIGNTNIKICKINSNFKIINTYLFETKKTNFEANLNRKLKKIINNYKILTNLKKKYELSNWRYWKYKYKNL